MHCWCNTVGSQDWISPRACLESSHLNFNLTRTKPSRLFNHEHTVGILGSSDTTPAVAASQFMKKLEEVASQADLRIPIVLCSHANNLTLEALVEQKNFLEQAGARCIVMPCDFSSAKWYKQLKARCSVPLLDRVSSLVDQLKLSKITSLHGTATKPRIGVLASLEAAEYYKNKLQEKGFDVCLPDKATTNRLLTPAIQALQRKDFQGYRSLTRIAVQTLLVVNAANMVVVEEDITGAFSQDEPVLSKCIDPTECLVEATIAWAEQQVMRSST